MRRQRQRKRVMEMGQVFKKILNQRWEKYLGTHSLFVFSIHFYLQYEVLKIYYFRFFFSLIQITSVSSNYKRSLWLPVTGTLELTSVGQGITLSFKGFEKVSPKIIEKCSCFGLGVGTVKWTKIWENSHKNISEWNSRGYNGIL